MGSIINPLLILRDENDSFNLFYSLCSLRYSPEIEIDTDQTQLSFLSTNLSTFFPVSFRDPVSQPPLSGKKVWEKISIRVFFREAAAVTEAMFFRFSQL